MGGSTAGFSISKSRTSAKTDTSTTKEIIDRKGAKKSFAAEFRIANELKIDDVMPWSTAPQSNKLEASEKT
jgi:hypothetical protein